MMEPMRNGMMEMMITFLLPAMSEMMPPIKQPRMAVKAQHEAVTMFVFIWKLANLRINILTKPRSLFKSKFCVWIFLEALDKDTVVSHNRGGSQA